MRRNHGITAYDRLVWLPGELEQALCSVTRRRDAEAYLGAREFETLQPLAVQAARSSRDPQQCVYLIPGVMGSQLGLHRTAPQPPDLLWIDPLDVQHGRLIELQRPDAGIVSLGPVYYSYLALKLRLESAGFTVRWFDYDWRRDVREIGAALAARVRADQCHSAQWVAHSLGGLVARAALATLGDDVQRLITLGTPHGGSYAPLQALRGSYVTVRRIAQLDPQRSAEQLATEIFSTFPSLHQMLPEQTPALNLPAPAGTLLCLAGTQQDTVIGIEPDGKALRYLISRDGDGTVATASATLDGHPAWYTPTLHGELPRDAGVAETLIDLLHTGRSSRLPQHAPTLTLPARSVTDETLRAVYTTKLDWAALTPAERRDYFETLNAPVAAGSLIGPAS